MELEMLLATRQVFLTNKETGDNLVELDEHGVENGWANWPLDFDPTWVKYCAFFNEEEKEG